MLPSLVFFIGFVIYPMVQCIITSFFDSTMNRADIFVGLANYKELFTNPVFLGGAEEHLCHCYCIGAGDLHLFLWVGSVLNNMSGPLCSLFRCVFYLPVVTGSGVHSGMEVDVQQLLWHFQLCGKSHGSDRQEYQLAGR